MGIIVGFAGAALAAAGLLVAWIAGRVAGRFWFALGVIVAAEAIAGLFWLWRWPIQPDRPETAVWPMALAFAATLSLFLALYGVMLRRLRRRLSQQVRRS
jgi:hypothetical protein